MAAHETGAGPYAMAIYGLRWMGVGMFANRVQPPLTPPYLRRGILFLLRERPFTLKQELYRANIIAAG